MHTIFKNNHPALTFFYIPKTASVSLGAALYTAFSPGLKNIKLKKISDVPHANMHNLTSKDDVANNRVCVLRHPYDRAKSLWQHSSRRVDTAWASDSFELFLIKRFHETHILLPNTELDLDNFNFFAPQWHWAQHCNIRLDFNNLHHDFNNILTEYVSPGIYNLPRKNVLNSKDSVNLKRYHKTLIRKIYADDFEHLGFIP